MTLLHDIKFSSHERSSLYSTFLSQVGGALLARLLETATIPAYFAKPK